MRRFCTQQSCSLSTGGGKLAVLGSGAMFSDAYIDKEDNGRIRDVIFDFLTVGLVKRSESNMQT